MIKIKSNRNNKLMHFILALVIIISLNLIGSIYFFRIDMTAEKRYSLTNSTKELLRELDDIVYFKVYLEGDFPAGFRRLSNQSREILEEFRAYSDYVHYEFINPLQASDSEQREANINDLMKKGLSPTQLQVKADDASSQQLIFPAALVSYKGYEVPVQLLQDQIGMEHENILNNSVQALEYNFATAIRQLITEKKPIVGFLSDIGEPHPKYLADIKMSLSDFYTVRDIKIDSSYSPLKDLETLIIPKPRKEFTEDSKFLIDQYIMQGGSCLWLIDPVFADMDSLKTNPETIGMYWPLNIDDMLFRYGVRFNPDLLKDLHSVPIPVTTGMVGNRPQISLVSWHFFPMITPISNHPIVKNLNAIKTEFVSSIDTVGTPSVKKTVLLETSSFTRIMNTPARISLDILHNPPDESLFKAGPQAIAVLLEGEFESIYRNRLNPGVTLPDNLEIKEYSNPTKMIVVSDGDIILNQLNAQGQPYPLGYDKYLNENFGNRDFILNAINYLANDPSIMEARNKEVRLRLLDKTKVKANSLKLQLANTLLPVLIIVIFGLIRFWIRKGKYS